MEIKDPIEQAESLVRVVHDTAGKYTQPVLNRYPLLFAFLFTFSVAAIIHGFEIWSDTIPFFTEHPTVVMFGGMLVLFFTGSLYKFLDSVK